MNQFSPIVLSAALCLLTGCSAFLKEDFCGATCIKGKPSDWTTPGSHRIDSSAVSGWVGDFGNDTLCRLAQEAVNDNFSLAAAMQRMFQAEQRARISRAALLPRADGGFTSSRSQNVGSTRNRTGTQVFLPAGRTRSTRHGLSLDLAWEVDLWGRLRDLRNADLAAMDAQCYAYQAARLSLVANVLQTAFQIIESREQVAIARRNLESLQTVLEILDAKLEGGDAEDRTALDISLARSDVARARSTIVAERRQGDASRRLLETLLGRYPEGRIDALHRLPDPRKSVPVGLPSDLLLRRPDILQAEMSVQGAIYGVSASRKQLLPSLGLTGDIGTTSSNALNELFDFDNLVWTIGQNLMQPVFRAGEIRAQIQLSEHERDELINEYAELVLTAFREVEVALAAEQYYDAQVEELRVNVREARLAESLSVSQYEKGLVDIITVLDSQRRAFDAESSLLDIRLQRLLNRVDLYLALGGDFETCPVEKGKKTVPHQKGKAIAGPEVEVRPVRH